MLGQGEGPRGKLARLARVWAGGRSRVEDTDEFDKECKAFGIDPDALRWEKRDEDRPVIWPDMDPSVTLFFNMATQWRWASAGMAGAFRTGLEYVALEPTARALRIEMTPRLFADIQVLEREALATWSRK